MTQEPQEAVVLSSEIVTMLTYFAQKDVQFERCGFVVQDSGLLKIVEILNSCPRPEHAFSMNPEDLIKFYEEHGQPVGVWHTHPMGSKEMSPLDIIYAPYDMAYWTVTREGMYQWDIQFDPPKLVREYRVT